MDKLIVKAMLALENFKRSQSGASLIEYSLLIGLITVAAVVAIGVMGGWVNDQWTDLKTNIDAAP